MLVGGVKAGHGSSISVAALISNVGMTLLMSFTYSFRKIFNIRPPAFHMVIMAMIVIYSLLGGADRSLVQNLLILATVRSH